MHPLPNLSQMQQTGCCPPYQLPNIPQIIPNIPSTQSIPLPFSANTSNSMFVPVANMNINGNPNTVNNINIGYSQPQICNYGHIQSFPSPTLTFQSDPTPIMPISNNQMIRFVNNTQQNNHFYQYNEPQTQHHAQKQNLFSIQQQYDNDSLPKFPQIPIFSTSPLLNVPTVHTKQALTVNHSRKRPLNIPRFLNRNSENEQQFAITKHKHLFAAFEQKKEINENIVFCMDEEIRQNDYSTMNTSLPCNINNAFS